MGFAEGTGLFWLAGMANGVRFFAPPYWKIEQRPSAPRRIRTMMGDTFKYVAGETVMYFSKEAIQNLAESYGTMNARAEALIVSHLSYNFGSARAREFAQHGFARRIETLTHCIENVWLTFEPDDERIPTKADCIDATAYIQAFIFNVFGALDNLAWIWVEEKKIRSPEGNQLREERVGLGKKHKQIRRTLSPEFREYLNKNNAWFEHLANFRHALAHRIPLYIPRYAIVNGKAYEELQKAKDALKADPDEYDRLTEEQMKHVQFLPVMRHSISEKSKSVVFHPQLLSDFAIVEEIGKRMLKEFERAVPPQKTQGLGLVGRIWRCLRSGI
jgi:hypothetical protein